MRSNEMFSAIVPTSSDRITWEEQVSFQISEWFECDTSDAQGIMMAKEDYVDACWEAGISAEETAKKI